jgi:branched-chain amino acid transport system permease protein
MLTLAFAQIVWSIVFQWDEVTGGSNGLVGVWPSSIFASKTAYFYLTLVLVGASLFLLRRILLAPFGYAMRAGRDSPLRAEATGINVVKVHWIAFAIAGWFCGLAGALFAFAKGTISPETISVGRSVDALVMVLLGGVQSLAGPVVGAVAFTWLQDTIIRATDYWRAVFGVVILVLVLVFPQGLAGGLAALAARLRWKPR